MRTATSRSSGLSAGTSVEIKNLYLDGVLPLQHVISGFVACFPVVAAKK
jgi:hypothetical protein